MSTSQPLAHRWGEGPGLGQTRAVCKELRALGGGGEVLLQGMGAEALCSHMGVHVRVPQWEGPRLGHGARCCVGSSSG